MPIIDRLDNIWALFYTWVWKPGDSDGNLLQRCLRATVRILFIVMREMKRDRITLRAGALTYTIVLSLVPTLALGTAVLKGLGAGDQMRQVAYRFIDQLESPEQVPVSPAAPEKAIPAEPEAPPATGEAVEPEKTEPQPSGKSLTSHLRRAVDQIFNYVDQTDFATLGAFGIVGLVLAVLSVLGSIEKAMNTIWQAESDRPFSRKLMDYLALIILLPITVNLALATETTLQSPALLSRFHGMLSITWLGHFLLKMIPIIAVVATFTLLYRFIPNTRVRFFPALIGGIFGGIGWLVVQMFYIKLQIGVARYNAIYGSFATLPLLLLWIHLGWIIFLAGAEMAFATQVWRQYSWQETLLSPVARLAVAFHITGRAMIDYHARKVTDTAELADTLNQPPVLISKVVKDLVAGGVLRSVCDHPSGYVPAAPEEEIKPAEIIDLVFGREVPEIRGGRLATDAMAGARSALAGRKMVDEVPAISADSEQTE